MNKNEIMCELENRLNKKPPEINRPRKGPYKRTFLAHRRC